MLTAETMLKISNWTSLYVEVRLLQASIHSTSSAVPKVPCTACLAVHLQMSSAAGADMFPSSSQMHWHWDSGDNTRQMCKGEGKKSVPFCAFLISVMQDKALFLPLLRGARHKIYFWDPFFWAGAETKVSCITGIYLQFQEPIPSLKIQSITLIVGCLS